MKSNFVKVAACAAALTVYGSASAFLWTFYDQMDGLPETPPNSSPAFGYTFGTYDDVTNVLTIDVNASGFVAPITAAHVHRAPLGVAGPVIFPLTGATGGTSYTSHDVFNLNASQETDILAGLNYANVHSQVFPGGEIRGQIHLVPEPATLGFLACGLAALMAKKRRLRRG